MEMEIAGKDRSGSDPTVLELSEGVFGVSREWCASRGKGTAGLIYCGRRSVLATYGRRLTGIKIEFTGAIGSRELVCDMGWIGGVLAGLDSVLMYTAQGSVLLVLDGLSAGWPLAYCLFWMASWKPSRLSLFMVMRRWLAE
ncbi:hypothetical protein DY000_02037417 [Brassica cretica]|uniref:Uncharacterized protein n=1 Tax=Brassica cretica TaxID=69181 RepID=A0ABQ7BBU4_BRACR|nr:hypothetical protein DY000_02037417 [Brassica cretica]